MNSNNVSCQRLARRSCILLVCGVCAFPVVYSGCAPGNDSTDASRLAGTIWVLESFVMDGIYIPPIPGSDVTIVFDDNGNAHGSSGCNSYSGEYRAADNGTMSFGSLACTEMYCLSPEGVNDQENRYLSLLGGISSFESEADRLSLFCEDDTRRLIYVARNQ